jgi:NADPH:quinone reductase-like Zn-dependent oxidoreductase
LGVSFLIALFRKIWLVVENSSEIHISIATLSSQCFKTEQLLRHCILPPSKFVREHTSQHEMFKAIFIDPIDGKPGKPGQVYYPLSVRAVPKHTPRGSELLIKLTAASLNHRDVFLRQHLYPGVAFDVPLGSDGVGIVVGTGPAVSSARKWQGKRVVLNPTVGWKESPEGPEDPIGNRVMGGNKVNDKGTLQEYVSIDESEVEEAPEHLSDAEAAALPLTGLTGWRALVTKAGERNSSKGSAVLITGIGGGTALMVLHFAVARGAHVYVTSSSEEKIQKAIELGAKGGVNYKEEDWEIKLLGQLPEGKAAFDAIIDGAGGDSIEKSVKLLKVGACSLSWNLSWDRPVEVVIIESQCSDDFLGWWCPLRLWNDSLA